MMALHKRYIIDLIDKHVPVIDGTYLVHCLGSWSGVGGKAADLLRKKGQKVVVLATPWTTYNHEARGKLFGVERSYSCQ
jgi:hypothetical protein